MGKAQLSLWKLLSAHGIYVFVFFFLGLWFANDWNTDNFILLCLSLTVTLILTFAIRYTVKRSRPKFLSTGYVPALQKYSFPSAHASSSFSLAVAIVLIQLSSGLSVLGLATAIALLASATIISLSRIMVGVHYLTDVLAGAALGAAIPFLLMYFL